MKKNIRARHYFWFGCFRPIVRLFLKLKFGFQNKIYKLKKGENYLILSNHQTDLDAVILPASFNRPVYMVGTDTLLSNGFSSRFLLHAFGVIPKKKGGTDLRCVMLMLKIAKEGGCIGMFPEGNRTYAEFQFEIGNAIVPLVRKMGIPVCIYNIHGGTGCFPRFGKERREGPFSGEVKEVLTKDRYSQMTDEELKAYLLKSIRVFDSENGNTYQSNSGAEYLEREFYVCPSCKATCRLTSLGDTITCSNCNTTLKYSNQLKFDENRFGIRNLNDWYQMQKAWVREYVLPEDDSIIFEDSDVTLYSYEYKKKRTLLAKGSIKLYKDRFVFNENYEILISKLTSASSISGVKFNFSCDDTDYLVVGKDRFNPLKYVQMLHRLDTEMTRTNSDIYYSISD